jgi:hypothetical protein
LFKISSIGFLSLFCTLIFLLQYSLFSLPMLAAPPQSAAGETLNIDGFPQPDGLIFHAFTFTAPNTGSSDFQFSSASLMPSLPESSARPATLADSIGRIRVQIFAATAPPHPQVSSPAASASASESGSSQKRELDSATFDDEQTAKRGKVEDTSSRPSTIAGMSIHTRGKPCFCSVHYHDLFII